MCESRPVPQERRYSNYLSVGHNAFEFMLDFGQQDEEGAGAPHTRIMTSPIYAKAYLEVLRKAIADYEFSYGQIPEDELR